MSADMDLAEAWAGRMCHDTPETLAEWSFLVLGINESRTKEALLLGNLNGPPAFYELHVWAWKDNPRGSFADWNPSVSCDAWATP